MATSHCTSTLYRLQNNQYLPISNNDIINQAKSLINQRFRKGCTMQSAANLWDYLQLHFFSEKNELFGCLFLDNQKKIIAIKKLFYGTVNSARVHPRIVLQHCLTYNACGIIPIHNHPSGFSQSSWADMLITNQLNLVLGYINVKVLDHIIIGVSVYSTELEKKSSENNIDQYIDDMRYLEHKND